MRRCCTAARRQRMAAADSIPHCTHQRRLPDRNAHSHPTSLRSSFCQSALEQAGWVNRQPSTVFGRYRHSCASPWRASLVAIKSNNQLAQRQVEQRRKRVGVAGSDARRAAPDGAWAGGALQDPVWARLLSLLHLRPVTRPSQLETPAIRPPGSLDSAPVCTVEVRALAALQSMQLEF